MFDGKICIAASETKSSYPIVFCDCVCYFFFLIFLRDVTTTVLLFINIFSVISAVVSWCCMPNDFYDGFRERS